MALIRWEPARELQSIQQEVNRLFGSFLEPPTGGNGSSRWIPAMDLVEGPQEYVLRADLPGVAEDEVKVELEDNVLTIAGERRSERHESREGYRRVERATGRFARSLTLPDGVDPQGIRASFERGVLDVRIPKPQQRKSHRVEIHVGGGEAQAGAPLEAAPRDAAPRDAAPQDAAPRDAAPQDAAPR